MDPDLERRAKQLEEAAACVREARRTIERLNGIVFLDGAKPVELLADMELGLSLAGAFELVQEAVGDKCGATFGQFMEFGRSRAVQKQLATIRTEVSAIDREFAKIDTLISSGVIVGSVEIPIPG